MIDENKSCLNLVIGINNTGKTTLVRDKFLDRTKEKVLVFNPTGEPKWNGYDKIQLEGIKDFTGKKRIEPIIDWEKPKKFSFIPMFKAVDLHFYNGHFVIDDTGELINANLTDQAKTLMRSYRQHRWIMWTIFHAISDVPKGIMNHVNGYIFLFQTNDKWDEVKYKIPDRIAEEFHEKYLRVNKEADRLGDPRGIYEIIEMRKKVEQK